MFDNFLFFLNSRLTFNNFRYIWNRRNDNLLYRHYNLQLFVSRNFIVLFFPSRPQQNEKHPDKYYTCKQPPFIILEKIVSLKESQRNIFLKALWRLNQFIINLKHSLRTSFLQPLLSKRICQTDIPHGSLKNHFDAIVAEKATIFFSGNPSYPQSKVNILPCFLKAQSFKHGPGIDINV